MDVGDLFDAGDDVAGLTRAELAGLLHVWQELADLDRVMNGAGSEELDLLALGDRPLHDSHVRHHPAERIVLAVEDEGFERCLRIALRRRDAFDDHLEDVVDADALLRGDLQGVGRGR